MTDQQPESTTPQDGAPQGAPSAPPPPPPAHGAGATPPPPPPPAGGYAPPPAGGHAAAQGAGVTGQAALSQSDERLWGMLGHIGAIILGFIAPLITWLVFRERSAFVDDQGKEALNFQITVLIGYVVAWVLAFVAIGLVLLPVIWIGSLVLSIMAGLAAQRGERYRYPFALRLVK